MLLLGALLAGWLPWAHAEDEGPADAAQALALDGRFAAARDQARAALAADKTDLATARLLQDVLRAMGDLEGARTVAAEGPGPMSREGLAARLLEGKDAVKKLTAVLRMEGAYERFRLDLALAHLAMGTESAAEASAKEFLDAHEDDVEGLAVYGMALAARGKDVGARKAFAASLEGAPGYPPAALGLARLHVAEARPEEARATLDAALAVHPRHPHLLLALAERQGAAGEHDDALRTLAGVLELPVPKADVHARMAAVHRAKGTLPEAARCAGLALAIDKENTRALRVRGFTKFKAGDLAGAQADYEAVAALEPENAQIQADLALVHLTGDDLKAAEAAAEKAIDLDKDLLDGHLRLGQVLYLAGEGKKAKRAFGAVLKLDKEHLLVNRYMGYVLLDEGKPKTAIKYFETVAEADPKDSSSVRMIGRCHLASGRVEDAVASFQEAVARNDKDAFAYFDLGKGLERQEKWDDAIAAYQRAIEADAKLPHPHLYLAELLDGVQGEPEEALVHYKRYLELGGKDENKSIAKRVEQLEKP